MIDFLYGLLFGFVGANVFLYYVEVYDERQKHSRTDK